MPDSALPIDWTSEGVLGAIRGLPLSVPANALPPGPEQPPWRPRPWQTAPIEAVATIAGLAGASPGQKVVPPMVAARAGQGPRALARARQAARVAPHALRLTEATGSASLDLVLGPVTEAELGPLPAFLFRPEPAPPGPNQTALELPWRVILSPNEHGAWFHADGAARSEETGHTELWHTRLGVRLPDGRLVDGGDPLRTVRAVWTTEEPPPATPAPGDKVTVPKHANSPFRTSLDGFDRHSVVHLSSNFRLHRPPPAKGFYEPRALDVDLLALTALGGWLDSRGVWDERPLGLSVEEWRHRATVGRDHYVRVVYAGRLFPLGHRASLIKITERRFEGGEQGNPAYLRQRMFILVREQLRTYRESGWVYEGDLTDPRTGERWDLKLPFKAIRITTLVSPLLDPPEDSGVAGAPDPMSAFWPFVGRSPFCFRLVGTDVEDQAVDLAMPLIFIGEDETDSKYDVSIVPTKIADDYRSATWPGTSVLRATVPLGGQSVAFAESADPQDTSFPTETLTFDAEVPKQAKYDSLLPRQPRFLAVIRTARLRVPALQRIARTAEAAAMAFDQTYLHEGFEDGNPGQVFLARDPATGAVAVEFSARSDRSGGLVAPDIALSGLSRVTGPVSGDVGLAAAGSLDPKHWFGALADAKLFGVLSLADIVAGASFGQLDALPRFVGGPLDQIQRLVADLERLQRLLSTDPIPAAGATATVLDALLDPVAGSIPALFGGGATSTVVGQLVALESELAGLPAAVAASDLPAGPKAVLAEAAASVRSAIGGVLALPTLLQSFADGDLLPEDLSARFEWRPTLQAWPSGSPIFIPAEPRRNLVVSVDAQGEDLVVTASLDDFVLDLAVLVLDFERVQFRARAGRKPEVDVAFTGFQFAGPLSFIETLRQLVPLDGFADPPEVEVTPQGITAGFSMGLPNVAFGVFSLENLSLAAGFSIPFVGPPMSTWFRFCERENPSRLTVMMFGGGFYFGVTVNADGLQVAEGAIEFGAAISVNFGVASGSVSAMAGLYFKIESGDVSLAGYFRLRGEVEALGIVSVSLELYLEMLYEDATGKCVGTATISIEVDVALFSATVKITCSKQFAGAGADPTLAEMFDVGPDATSADWDAYCGAFA